jgi:MscS family membrane protein
VRSGWTDLVVSAQPRTRPSGFPVDVLRPVAAYTALNKGDPWLWRPRRCILGALCLLLAALTLSFPSALAQDTASPIAELERHPLQPLDASSPQATLRGFVTNIEAAADVILMGGPTPTAEALAYRAFRLIDLPETSNGSPAIGGRTSSELARVSLVGTQLVRILQRVQLPPWESVPGTTEVAARALDSWTLPDTEITIAKVASGPRAGMFLFTAETVARLPEFWERVRHLPVRPQARRIELALETLRTASQWPVVQAAVVGLPAPLLRPVLGLATWKWVGLAIVLTAAIGAFLVALRLAHAFDRRRERPLARLGLPLVCGVGMAAVPWLQGVLDEGINLFGGYRLFFGTLLDLVFYMALIALVILLIGRVAEGLIRIHDIRPVGIDAALVRLTARVVAIAAAIYLVIHGAERLGVPVAPLLAGLGVGGLAIALAVRPTLENAVGGFVLFGDRPVRVGEFCRFGDKMGTIEEVGLRSTRIRGLDRTVITVPNAEFSQMQIVNFTRRDQMLYQITLGLRYETTPDQLRHVMAAIREMLIRHERVSPDPARVRLLGFGPSSLDIEIFAYVSMSDYDAYLGVREDLNLRILEIVAASGTGFAFPSQTVYLSRDQGLHSERGQQAAEEVELWRREGRLPFPEFTEEERARLSDTLPFPPAGSPHARPRDLPRC